MENRGKGGGTFLKKGFLLPSQTHPSSSQGYILVLNIQIIFIYFNKLLMYKFFFSILPHIFCHIFRFGNGFNRGNFLGVKDVLIVF